MGKRYGGIPVESSNTLSTRSPKRHARHTASDILNLVEARKFLGVQNDADVLGDWQHGSRRTRSYTRLEQAHTRRTAQVFHTPQPTCQLASSTATATTFTAYFSGDRYKGTSFASVPDDQRPTASPCERTLCRRHHKAFFKHVATKYLGSTVPGTAVRVRLTAPQTPRRLRLTTPRPPIRLFFPAGVVVRNRAQRLAQAALQELHDREIGYIRP